MTKDMLLKAVYKEMREIWCAALPNVLYTEEELWYHCKLFNTSVFSSANSAMESAICLSHLIIMASTAAKQCGRQLILPQCFFAGYREAVYMPSSTIPLRCPLQ
jgi:hypothetical protein